eukprot:12195727-Karenia_brevis.AAC.1
MDDDDDVDDDVDDEHVSHIATLVQGSTLSYILYMCEAHPHLAWKAQPPCNDKAVLGIVVVFMFLDCKS